MKNFYKILTIDFDKNRIYGLDILRAVAILSVVTVHGSGILPTFFANTFMFIPDGVSIFFVLSGFLIGGIIIKFLENQRPIIKTLFEFWSKRWLRTLPLYYCVLILLIVLSKLFIKGFNIRETPQFFIFMQNFDKSHSFFFNVSWSLSVEEWFYLVTPFLFFIITSLFGFTPKKVIIYTALTVVFLSISYRYYRYSILPVDTFETFDIMFRRPVLTRLDSLMLGVIGAYLFCYKTTFLINNKNMFFIAGIILHLVIKISVDTFLRTSAFYYCNLSLVLEPLATLLLLPFLSQLKSGKGFIYKMITCISLVSYSMYLLHDEIVKNWIIWFVNLPGISNSSASILKYILYWVLTIVLSVLSYKYIEMPFMKLRKNHK